MKKRGISILLCIVILLGLLTAGVGVWMWTRPEKETEPTAGTDALTPMTFTKEEMAANNAVIEEKLGYALRKVVNNAAYSVEWSGIPWDEDYFADSKGRARFAFAMLSYDETVPKTEGVDAEGHLVRDAIAVTGEDYSAFYKTLFNAEADVDVFRDMGNSYTEKDGSIYATRGLHLAGAYPFFAIKFRSFSVSEKDGTCLLTLDLLADLVNDSLKDANRYILSTCDKQYADPSVTEYPDTLAVARVSFGLHREGDTYYAESLKVTALRQPPEPTETALYNAELMRKLQHAVQATVADYPYQDYFVEGNYLTDPESRAKFAWFALIENRDYPREYSEEVTGEVFVDVAVYKECYSRLFREEADVSALLRAMPRFKLEGDRIHGTFPTGYSVLFLFKYVSMTEPDENGDCTVYVDMITATDTETDSYPPIDYDIINAYGDPNLTEYPAEAVGAKLLLHLRRTGEEYSVTSFEIRDVTAPLVHRY